MYCGSSISVKEAVEAHGVPDAKNILQTAITFLESRNYEEANKQLTRVLEYDPENRTAWLCKAIIASSPTLKHKFFFWNAFQEIEPYILQAKTYFGKALTAPGIEDECFREKAAGILVRTAASHLKGGDGSRTADNADRMFNLDIDLLRDAAYRSALSFMTLGALCLNAAYCLRPCKAVAEEIRSYRSFLQRFPVPYSEWMVTGQLEDKDRAKQMDDWFIEWAVTGRSTLYDLEQKINKEHPDWDTKPTKEQTKTNQCFIATATIGDPDHPAVVLLREFRDDYLLNRSAGRLFVRWYYAIGPVAARVIARSLILRRITYWLVVRPAAKMAGRSMKKARRGEV